MNPCSSVVNYGSHALQGTGERWTYMDNGSFRKPPYDKNHLGRELRLPRPRPFDELRASAVSQ